MYPLHFNYMSSPEQRERQEAVMRRISPILDVIRQAVSQGYKVERVDISSELLTLINLEFFNKFNHNGEVITLYGVAVAAKDDMEHDFTVVSTERKWG